MMPKIAVEIEWDRPDEPFWLNADNVALALHAYCKNTKFVVCDVKTSPDENPEPPLDPKEIQAHIKALHDQVRLLMGIK